MKKKRKELQTDRLLLKPLAECDRQQMIDIFLNEDIKKTYMIPAFDDPKQADRLFEKMMDFSKSDHHFLYGIHYHNRLIGFLNDCEIQDSTIEIGYVIIPEFQRMGFATEALRICIDELFRIGFEHVIAGFFQENIASCRVMQKCGMKKIPLEDDIVYRGILRHCLYYGINNPHT